MFFIQDALFLLGYLARGNAFPKPLSREEEAEMIERMQRGGQERAGKAHRAQPAAGGAHRQKIHRAGL